MDGQYLYTVQRMLWYTNHIFVFGNISLPIEHGRTSELTLDAGCVCLEDAEEREAALDDFVTHQPLMMRDGECAVGIVDFSDGEELMALTHDCCVVMGTIDSDCGKRVIYSL